MQTQIGANPIEHPRSANAPNKPQRLVVLVPGISGLGDNWASLKARLALEPGYKPEDAVWLEFDHGTGLFSLGPVDECAHQLRNWLDAKWHELGEFNDIVLIGHSIGGLIARQAFLLSSGAVIGEPSSEWSRAVSRIVLLATLNRGVPPLRGWLWGFFRYLTRLIPFLPHFRGVDAVRGSSFLTNLRINWIRHFGALEESQEKGETWPDGRLIRAPVVVQLLGEKDGIVSPEDSKDILAFPQGYYLEVPGAGHDDLYRLDRTPEPETRYAVLRQGFVGDFASKPQAESSVKRVVFLLHGIRASNVDAWIKDLERQIRERDSEHTIVKHPTYGYFSAARFFLPSVRKKNIPEFQDWYTEALAEHPTAEFNIIAHSNGTYLLGQSLLHTPGMRFTHVALAGSVLPCNFPWDELKASGQIKRVRNDRANRDWPVALLCNGMRGLRMLDVGTGGFSGFNGDTTQEIAYYVGGHGEVLTPKYQKQLIDFVFGQDATCPETLVPSPGYYRQLSNVMPHAAQATALAISLGTGWYWFGKSGSRARRMMTSMLLAASAYVVLDIL